AVKPRRKLTRVRTRLFDDLPHQRLQLTERDDAREPRPTEETKRLEQRRERERQRLGRSGATGHGASASSGSIAYSTKSTSRISYSRSPPGVRIFTVSPASRPISPRAMGLVMLMRPFLRSASVSPTMLYCVFAPESVSSSFTVAPKTTRSPESLLTSMICARARRSSSMLMRSEERRVGKEGRAGGWGAKRRGNDEEMGIAMVLHGRRQGS